jgi:HEAT repeat protein
VSQESRAFTDFRESLGAPRADRRYADDFDLGSLAALHGDERAIAEDLLLDRLAADAEDDRVAPALAILRSQRAVEPLRAALAAAQGSARVRFAQALAQLDPGFDPGPEYLSSLSGSNWSARGQAAGALAGTTEPAAIEGLLDALDREPFGARIQAFDALVQSLDLATLKAPRHSPLREIGMMLLSDLPAVARDAASRMRRVVEGLQAGQPAQALGLIDAPTHSAGAVVDQFLQALQNRDEPDRDFPDLDQLA